MKWCWLKAFLLHSTSPFVCSLCPRRRQNCLLGFIVKRSRSLQRFSYANIYSPPSTIAFLGSYESHWFDLLGRRETALILSRVINFLLSLPFFTDPWGDKRSKISLPFTVLKCCSFHVTFHWQVQTTSHPSSDCSALFIIFPINQHEQVTDW